MCDPILVTLLKTQPHYSKSSPEDATPSRGTFPLASDKEVHPQGLTGGPSSSCESLKMILRNSGHGENVRVCIGIFTISFRKHCYYKNVLSYFHDVLLAVYARTFPIKGNFSSLGFPL